MAWLRYGGLHGAGRFVEVSPFLARRKLLCDEAGAQLWKHPSR